MKSWFEEYGLIVVAIICIFILISMTTPVGDAIKSAVLRAVDSLTNIVSTTPEVETTTSALNLLKNI